MYSMPLIDGPHSVRPMNAEDVKGTNIWGDGFSAAIHGWFIA